MFRGVLAEIETLTSPTSARGVTADSNGVIAGACHLILHSSTGPGFIFFHRPGGNSTTKELQTMDLNKLIDKRRAELARFDAMTAEEQRKATERGENPHDKPAVRKRKKAAYLEKEKRDFDALPKERRTILESLGASPYQRGQVVNRSVEYYERHGSYIIDPPGTTTEPEQ